MSSDIDVKEIEQKTFRYIEQDGLSEIMYGLLFIGARASFVTSVGALICIFVLPFIAAFFFPRFIEAFRKRYTYPRIGYAKLPEDDPQKNGKGMLIYMPGVLVVFVICLFLFGDVTDPALYRKWCPTVIGLVWLGVYSYEYSKSGSFSCWIYAFVTLSLALLFSILDFDGWEGVKWWILSMGAFFLITGLVYFVLFLHRYPMPAEEVSDEEK